MNEFVECDVGMTEYVGKHDGFSAILKFRYQDFLVNEIDQKGNILHFTKPIYNVPESEVSHTKNEVKPESPPIELISENDQKSLIELQDGKTQISSVILDVENDKATRTRIHETIRLYYPSLDSQTIKDGSDNEVKIKVIKANFNDRKRKRKRFSKQNRILMRFLIYKENISTMNAVVLMLKKLHLNHANCFQYAGNKDKRAITVQAFVMTLIKGNHRMSGKISSKGLYSKSMLGNGKDQPMRAMTTTISPQRIISLNKSLKNIRVGNFYPCQTHLRLGDLTGNHFSIVLRNVEALSNEVISNAFSTFKNIGFVNYFGMQRFGTSGTSTFEIGKALLGSKWADAIDLILSSASEEEAEVLELIKSWKKENHASKAYEKMKNKSSFEGILLKGIVKFGTKQLLQALLRLPRPTRLLYLHSYQSYLWNRIVSRRLQHYGAVPVPGDLVYLKKQPLSEKDRKTNCCNDDDSGDLPLKKTKLDYSDADTRSLPGVKVLSDDDVKNYTITDVVLPLPGNDVCYPKNVKSLYEEFLQNDELTLKNFDHRVRDFYLPGAYRKIVVRPSNVEWDMVRYSDITKPLLVSDRDKVEGKSDIDSNADSHGKYQALRVRFDLPSSSYATVALRELTKCDMSIPAQTKLGDIHKRDFDLENSRYCSETPDESKAESVKNEVDKCSHELDSHQNIDSLKQCVKVVKNV